MTIRGGFSPKGINRWPAGFLDYLRKTRGFNLEQLHGIAQLSYYPSLSSTQKSPPENYGKEDQTTVAAFLPWRGLPVLNP